MRSVSSHSQQGESATHIPIAEEKNPQKNTRKRKEKKKKKKKKKKNYCPLISNSVSHSPFHFISDPLLPSHPPPPSLPPQRNSVYSRVDTALKGVREALKAIQEFAGEYLTTPLGHEVAHPREGQVAALQWLDELYSDPKRAGNPIPKEIVTRLEANLQVAQPHFPSAIRTDSHRFVKNRTNLQKPDNPQLTKKKKKKKKKKPKIFEKKGSKMTVPSNERFRNFLFRGLGFRTLRRWW